jgi:hypothetical protein
MLGTSNPTFLHLKKPLLHSSKLLRAAWLTGAAGKMGEQGEERGESIVVSWVSMLSLRIRIPPYKQLLTGLGVVGHLVSRCSVVHLLVSIVVGW